MKNVTKICVWISDTEERTKVEITRDLYNHRVYTPKKLFLNYLRDILEQYPHDIEIWEKVIFITWRFEG